MQTDQWLFDRMNRRILDTREITFNQPTRQAVQISQLLTVIKQDTNDDGRLSTDGSQTLNLTGPEWHRPAKITNRVLSVLSATGFDRTAFDIIFNTSHGTHAARIAVPTG